MKLRLRVREYWLGTVDPRPLALFRVAFALVILADAFDRLRDLTAFYTDAGMFPRAIIANVIPEARLPLLAGLIGSPSAATLMMAVGIGAALLLLCGLGGRVPALLSWLYLLTVNGRAVEVSDGSDSVMQVMCFWLIFAESDAALSLRRGARPAAIRALPVRLLEFQLALIYFVAGVRKLNSDWLSGGALFHILQSNDFARPLGMAMLEHPSLCAFMTHATLVVELGFLPLVLAWPRRGRVVAASAAAGLHAGIYLLMRVGMFPFVMAAGLCLFVPPSRIGPAAASAPAGALAWPRRWRLVAVLAGTLFALATASAFLRKRTPAPVARLLGALGLAQNWSMFMHATRVDGYWSGQGRLADGTRLDILAAWAPRVLPQASTRFSRWYKLRDNMSDNPALCQLLLDWICRQQHGPQLPRLTDATLTRWERPVREPDEPSHAFAKHDVVSWQCRVHP